MKATVITLCFTAMFAVGGCGGAKGDQTYEGDGYTFTYPGSWEERGPSAAAHERDAIVGPASSDFEIMAILFSDQRPYVRTPADADEAIVDLASDLEEDTGIVEILEGPARISIGGQPAAQADMRLRNDGGDEILSRQTYVYQGTIWWLFVCNARPEHVEEMRRGCDQVEESFRFRDQT